MKPYLSEMVGEESRGTYKSYTIGFVISLILTLAAYFLVERKLIAGRPLEYAIIVISLLQVLVQMRLFLHVGHEVRPYWNFISFLFMALVIVILVGGSLWIMSNLDYRVMERASP